MVAMLMGQRYFMIPLAEPQTNYCVQATDQGYRVWSIDAGWYIAWSGTCTPVEYPSRERAEAVIRTASNPSPRSDRYLT